MSYVASPVRYQTNMQYRKTDKSGLVLPLISLGLWQNFGGVNVFETGRAILRHAFDNGITHFDLVITTVRRRGRLKRTLAAGWRRILPLS